jgi:hypothetical protein
MENFYKISKTDANKVGRFEYDNGCMFDPFCSEQVDGTYLVSESMVNLLVNNEKMQKVDWSKLTKINSSQINNKVVEL